MDLTSITASDLKKITSLIEKKAKLTEQIDAIDKELASFSGGSSATAKPRRGRRPGTTVKKAATAKRGPKKGATRGRRGGKKDAILAILQEAGAEGAAVKDIAKQLKSKPQNIHSWFQITGKKISEIKKVGTGKWAWVG